MLHVPYKGSAPALNGVLGGETQFMIDSVGSSIPADQGRKAPRGRGHQRQAAAGPARGAPRWRSPACPVFDVSTWFGLPVPKQDAGRSREPIATPALARGRPRPGVPGAVRGPWAWSWPRPLDPATFARFIDAETAKWGPLIKAKNITLE